jgi:uncharacterized repeat protein (TIGR01451 family)
MKSAILYICKSKSIFTAMLWVLLILLGNTEGFGQVTYRVGLDADKITYRIYMKSAVAYSNIQAKISTAQVTLLAPHGLGVNQFVPTNVQGKIAGSNQMSWGVSRANAPNENQLVDYISFGFSGSGSSVLFDIPANTEIELFNFQNSGPCLGAVSLITDTDPFLPPNSVNSNPGNQMTILGYGPSNAYAGNYGGNVNCQTTTTDLTVGITGPANITATVPTNYSINVNNIGTAASIGQITVTTTLPSGVSYNSFVGSGWGVSTSSQANGTTTVIATNSNVAAAGGALATLQLNVTAAASIGNGNAIVINSTVSGGADNNVTNNTASISSMVVVNSPNLALSMSGPSSLITNTSGNYTINIDNVGLAATSGTITASISLPNGMSYNSFLGNGWSYGSSTLQSGGAILVTFTNNNIIGSNSGGSPLIVNLTAGNNIANNTVVNIAGSVSGGGDATPANNSGSVNTTILANNSPNLGVTINGSSNVVAGSSTNYTINVSNSGTAASSGQITVNTTLPSGVLYNSFTGNGWNVTATPQANGTTLITATYTGSVVATGGANPLVLNVTPQTTISNGTTITINTVISGGGDTTPANNSASYGSIVSNTPNLNVNITGPTTVTAGGNYNYTVNINNAGTAATSGQISTSIVLPSGVSYNSFSGIGWSIISTPQANGTTLLTATYNGVINAGGAANPLVLNVTPQTTISNGSTLSINTTTSGGGNNGSASGSINILVVSPPSLTLSVNGSTTVSPNSTGNYTFNITNNSNTATSGQITQTIMLPAGVSYNSFTGSGWSFVSASPQANGSSILTFTYNNSIAGNSSATPLVINTGFASTLTNNAQLNISGTTSGGGSNSNSNNITITVVVASKPDLTLSINGTTSTTPNGSASYTINANNIGNAATNGQITVGLVVPNGLSYTSFGGSGWSYVSSTLQTGGAILISFSTNNIITANSVNNNLIVNFTAGNVPNGTVFTINGNISGGGETNTGNNSANVNLTIATQGQPILTALITGPLTVNVNTNYDYTINVNNTGNLATSGNTTVSTILPAGVSYNSTSGSNWTSVATLQPNGTTLVVSTYTGIIPANSTANSLLINVKPSGTLPSGTIFTINGAATGGGASNTGNNTFSISPTVSQSTNNADLAVAVNIDNNIPNVGQVVNYTFTITNNGSDSPSNAQSLIKLPAGFVVTGFNASTGSYNPNTGIWTIPTIANGQTFTFTISGKPSTEGIDFASIQIVYSTLQDNVSSNNLAKVCYATPVSLCSGEGFIAYLERGVTNVKWYKNSTQITSASADSLLITGAGSYSASYLNSCGVIVNTPSLSINNGIVPSSPVISTTKINICGTETAQLTASGCTDKITWITGATTSSISVASAGTYTATCSNSCGASQASSPIVITTNCITLGQIGDFVWYDDNNNGKQDATEAGVNGVILELYKDGLPTGLRDTTDNAGKYLFTNLSSGNYQVRISPLSLPTNYTLSRRNNAAGVSDDLDSDFDFNTNLSSVVVINTSSTTQKSNLTVDGGIRIRPEATIEDPCSCFDVEYRLTEKKELYEIVTVNGPVNDTWIVIQQTGMLALDSLVKRPVLLGTAMTQVSPGKYEINFTHEDNIGYTVKVSNGQDTLSISNFCSAYPAIKATELSQTICRNSPPIPLTVTMSTPGNANYYYIDKITKQKVVISSFDPSKFTAGETIYIKIEAIPANNKLCSFIVSQTVQISVIDCDADCKPVCVPLRVQKTRK